MATNSSEHENKCISNQNQRKLCELRVFELKSELQKRREDTTGNKPLLVSRLSNALEREGQNPDEYIFIIETTKKNTARRSGTSIGKMSAKEDADSDASEVLNDGQEMSDSLNENDISIDESINQELINETSTEKTGYEASDIIEDALQLAVDDELKEEREDMTVINENKSSSKVIISSSRNEVNSKTLTEDGEDMGVMLSSPPKPETAPVVVPLTIEDTINMDTSKQKKSASDDTSLIVNIDDTQSDVLDADLDVSNISTSASVENELNSQENNTESKSTNRKTNNEVNNSTESKNLSGNENNLNISTNTEGTNNSKECNKDSENKDSSTKSKSSNTTTKDNKVKNRDSKNTSSGQKVSQNSSNGRNIWVSGLSQSTKASELQSIFSKHGKVVSAKIIKNARMSSRCYGFITMENSEQVTKCINQLNKTDLHGRNISLSRNRPQENSSKPTVSRSKATLTKKTSTKTSDSKKESVKDNDNKETNKEVKNDEKSEENTRDKNSDTKDQSKDHSDIGSKDSKNESKDKRKPIRAPLRDRGISLRRPPFPFRRSVPFRRPFAQGSAPNFRGFRRPGFSRGAIRAGMPVKRSDVDRNIRERERERQLREERRRREELLQRDLEREERIRFEREKERLKFERMKLEREKAEFFRYEKERAKLEREKIEREREELRRRQQSQIPIQHRVDESRARTAIVASTTTKRPFETRDLRASDPYWEDRKRIQQVQRLETHILPGRQTSYVDSSTSAGNRSHISHAYENRNDSYKRRIEMPITGNSRSEFDARRHDSRHGSGHDRDERKSGSGASGSYYRDSSRGAPFVSRDRRISSQRDEWKPSHESRRDRYSDKPLAGGSTAGFGGNSRSYAGGDSRGWSDRTTSSLNKVSYGSGNVHLSGSQTWNASSSDRWNSAISSSNETRTRGQPSLNTSMLSGANPSIAELFGSSPMSGIGLNLSHSLGSSNNISGGDRQYLHSNRRF